MSAKAGGEPAPVGAVAAAAAAAATAPEPPPSSPPSTDPLSPRSSAPATPASSLAGGPPADPGSARGKGGRKAANPHLSDDERRRERVLKNRESAMKSLQKKKRYTESLEARAGVLSARNAELKAKIRRLLDRIPASSAAADLIATLPPLPPDLLPALPPSQLNMQHTAQPPAVYPVQSQMMPSHSHRYPPVQSHPQSHHRQNPSQNPCMQEPAYSHHGAQPPHDQQLLQQPHDMPAIRPHKPAGREPSRQTFPYPSAPIVQQPGHERSLQPATIPQAPSMPLAIAPESSSTAMQPTSYPFPVPQAHPTQHSITSAASVSLGPTGHTTNPVEPKVEETREGTSVGDPVSLPLGQIPEEVPRQLPSGLTSEDVSWQLFQSVGPDAENLRPQQLTFTEDEAGADVGGLPTTLDEAIFPNLDQGQDIVDMSAIMSFTADSVDASLPAPDL